MKNNVIAIQGNLIGRNENNGPQGGGCCDNGKMYTLTSTDVHAVCYRISSDKSNAMLSDNPNAGINMTEKSPTLDCTVPTPGKNQGGLAIVFENHAQDARYEEKDKCPTITSRYGTGGGNVPLVLNDQGGSQMSVTEGVTGTLRAQEHGHQPAVIHNAAIPLNTMACLGRQGGQDTVCLGIGNEGDPSPTISRNHHHGVSVEGQVRRLTPIECERLQGFPDNYTRIPYKGKPAENCPDSPRYRAIGNSWAVPCVRWIGERINKFLYENKGD